MQIISLNIWGGRLREPLLKFFKAHQDIDVFCLQEVYHNAKTMVTDKNNVATLDILEQILCVLPQHSFYFCPVVNDSYGLAIVIKKSIKVTRHEKKCIYHNPNYMGIGPSHSRYLHFINCIDNGYSYNICNLHGLWNGEGKGDTKERIGQSQQIKTFVQTQEQAVILAGDFNLHPNTKSIAIIKRNMLDLISRYNIKSTRTHWYPKSEKFADYIFVSTHLRVYDFRVLDDVVSDHCPIYVMLDKYL